MIKGTRVIIDLDDTMSQLTKLWVTVYNHKYKDNKGVEDVLGWDIENYLTKCSKEQLYDILNTPNFFRNVQRMPRVTKIVEDLQKVGCDITILSAYPNASTLKDKEYWLKTFMGIDRKDTIFGEKKSLIKGDIMIDDKPSNLEEFDGVRILFDQPHNRWATEEKEGFHFRVKDWWELEELLLGKRSDTIEKMLTK